jgi:2',3'-cyclic-nucleotide 2'-phosphodiesterase (5'-nucleotidase family)
MADRFPDASLYIMNSGGIRGGFQAAGPITDARVDEILPFQNSVVLLRMKGKDLIPVFERSVCALPELSGGFLQVSGVQVFVDSSRPPMIMGDIGEPVEPGRRVQGLLIGDEPVKDDREYLVATINFLAGGGDGYVELARAEKRTATGVVLNDIFEEYLKNRSPVAPVREHTYVLVNSMP